VSEGTLIAIVAIGGGLALPALLGGTAIVTAYLRKSKRDETSAALKREMIERGYTAEEIVRVIEAGTDEVEKKAAAVPGRCR
jgi:hypothetical protein